MQRIEPGPGQESVWDYPRPPRLESVPDPIRILFNGRVLAESSRVLRVLETSHPPTYYIPPEDIQMAYLTQVPGARSWCEWKGQAVYFDLTVDGQTISRSGWAYPTPSAAFQQIAHHLAFYASKMDACFVGEEQVQSQAGDFYGGWITSKIVGPFKGGAGTLGW